MAAIPKRRKVLSIEEKGAIIMRLESGEANVTIASEFGLSHSTISTIWKNRQQIKSAFDDNILEKKKLRRPENVDIDKALFQWFKNQRSRGIPISGPLLQAKAEDFARHFKKEGYKCSESWIKRFRQRHNIVLGKISGEARSVPEHVVEDWVKTVWPSLRKDYADENIFNADETGLFFKMLPERTFKFKGEKLSGVKTSKERITVLVAANMTGSIKRKLLVIGKSKSPRCFKNVKSLPVNYEAQRKAWMTSELFEKWIREWDQELRRSKNKILLLVDNCPAHPVVPNLSNIKLCFLPANTTSMLQPLDQGVIKSLKVHFRKFQIVKMLQQSEESSENEFKWKITILDAVTMISKAWDRVTPKTIANCFKHAGLSQNALPADDLEFEEEDEIPLAQLIKENNNIGSVLSLDQWEEFLHFDDNLPTSELPSDEDICDEIFQQHEQQEGEEDEQREDEVEDFNPPTLKEAMNATKILRNFVCFGNGNQSLLDKVSFLENVLESEFLKSFKPKQTKITEFFIPK